jgi:phenylalanyl-tRNA synthetase beta chain
MLPGDAKAFDLDGPVAAVELFLDRIPPKAAPGFARPHYAPPALQAVTRDFAFLVDAAVPAGDLVRAVKGPTRPTSSPRGCSTISGAGRARGAKSLAVEVTLQPGEKSYDDAALKAMPTRWSRRRASWAACCADRSTDRAQAAMLHLRQDGLP